MPIADPEQRREYNRLWKARRRAAWFEGKSCVRCGSNTNLQLDHVDPSTKVAHNVWSWSASRREVELAKCQVLCFSCHVQKTREGQEKARGEASGRSVLTETQVSQIRSLHGQGMNCAEIGQLLDINRKTVWDAVNRWWKHIGV